MLLGVSGRAVGVFWLKEWCLESEEERDWSGRVRSCSQLDLSCSNGESDFDQRK